VTPYLDRIATELARALERTPAVPAVALLDEPTWRSLALPSGTILLSLGCLESVEDEAELAFLLAHELAHAAARDVGAPLVRLGLAALARSPRGAEDEAWLRAASDLSRLGFAERREHAADARAVEALLRSGYDTEAAGRWIERLDRACSAGEPACVELALSHPPARDRLRRLTRRPSPAVAPVERRLNREVLRRVLARGSAPQALPSARPFDEPERRLRRRRERQLRLRAAAWTAVTIAVLATLLLLFGLL
jgi:predicted Zn-dependent protease